MAPTIAYLFLALIALPQVLAEPICYSPPPPSSPCPLTAVDPPPYHITAVGPPITVDELTFDPAEGQFPIVPDQDGPVANAIEQDVLNGHNGFRASHGASPLTWDNTLANFAKGQAAKCVFKHSGGPYGENLAAGTGSFSITEGINMWKNEAKDYNPRNPRASHFTQVVWKGTTRVGCAFVTCPPRTVFPGNPASAKLLWCNYNPPGNVIGRFPANVSP